MDNLDRLAANTHAIRVAASSSLPPSPFTTAVLNTSLGDLIRDIDPAELGLFTPQLSRVEFHRPAPRKKQDPEIYAQAAFKYIDRYNAIRPMPRAYAQVVAILDQLAATRENIRALTTTLDQIQPPELKILADKEEQRVNDLQARLTDLKQRKEAATAKPKPRKRLLKPKPAAPSTPVQSSSKFDETFNTPAEAGRTLRFTDNLLMDERVELADVSITSPIAPARFQERESVLDDSQDVADDSNNLDPAESGEGREDVEESQEEGVSGLNESTDDGTVVLPKPIATPPPPKSNTPKKGKVRVNAQVERIVAKIWSATGDVIMPGHPFDTSGTGGNKPPRAKETIAHLQTIAVQTPMPTSPSTTVSSLTAPAPGAPTPQQILTAHLLLALLAAGPHFSMPLNKVKEALAAKASTSGGSGAVLGGPNPNRALFGCVAKRLIKIERGGGEQIVKFDV
ncbi:hypothetical protein DFH07DRAFT_863560 [Mycena maculata]|uniref:Uncharacterized protein n=1 Tax=Mycena maculata TaxID=230809 RepID=A0AAD7H7S3_9AGAR|nr:hypothetical protein DFH07DRAFT_863560 [Mycena maculata]